MTEPNPWLVPRMWEGQTVAIFGGGPSLTLAQCEAALEAGWKSIAINDAYLLCPWADLLYWADLKWWGWHHNRPEFQAFRGMKVTIENRQIAAKFPGVKWVENDGILGFTMQPGKLRTGANSGYQCIGLAAQMGAKRIVLLGYDMRFDGTRSHWHKGHPQANDPVIYRENFLPKFAALAEAMTGLGIEVINCTPGSALAAFPNRDITELIHADRIRPH